MSSRGKLRGMTIETRGPGCHLFGCYVIWGENSYDLMDRINGLPKIALRKSGTETSRKICGLWLD